MKVSIIYLSAIIVTTVSSCASLPNYQYPEEAYLPGCQQGPIKKSISFEYELDTLFSVIDLKKDTTFYPELTLTSKTISSYNREGKVKKERWMAPWLDLKYAIKHRMKYDKYGDKKLQRSSYYLFGSKSTTTYDYKIFKLNNGNIKRKLISEKEVVKNKEEGRKVPDRSNQILYFYSDSAQLTYKIYTDDDSCDTLIINRYHKNRLIEQQTSELDEDYNRVWVVKKYPNKDKQLKYYYNNSSLDSLIRYEETNFLLFDSIEYTIEDSMFYTEDSVRQEFYYDALGNLIKRELASIDPWLLSDSKRETFDVNNKHIETYSDDRDCGTINNQYFTKYTTNGKAIYRTQYDYDSFGNEILKIEYNPNGNVIKRKEVQISYRHKQQLGEENKKKVSGKLMREHSDFYF